MVLDRRSASGAGETSTLAPGQLLAGRYRVVAPLGRGAVGEVYEAHDLELDERVALKILRPEIAGSERTLQRFKREIQLAHKVTHPNVCRVFDLVYHAAPQNDAEPGRRGGLAFLTMELLEGESLAELLERRERLPPVEALAIVRQVAAALTAAHTAGVVHRDLKSSNVLLVEATGGRRAVVTDFGLAVSPLGEAAASLTATGELVGSPAYMAPEQVRGEEPTPATDVYALGVVLFEMVTGELPFAGKSAFYTALKRLQEPPPSPRSLAPELGPMWEAVILRCLAREPGDRFASAEEVVAALAAAAPGNDAQETAPAHTGAGRALSAVRPASRALLLPALAGAALVLAAAAALWVSRESPSEPVSAAAPRRSVAVLGFQNLAGRQSADYLGTTLVYTLPTELAAGGRLHLLPVEEVVRAQRDLGLVGAASLSPDSLRRLRRRLGVDLVVSGTYLSTAGGEVRFDIVAQDARSGETVDGFTESFSESQFLAALGSLGGRLRGSLGGGEVPAAVASSRAGNPSVPNALRRYAEGLAALTAGEASQARDLLAQAVVVEPANPRIHAALAAAWADLGYDERARREARTAWELGAGLPPEERAAIEARHRELAGEWEAAIAIHRRLAATLPHELEHGLRLAAAQTAAGKGGEALATIAALRHRTAGRPEPRLELAEARAAASRSDFRTQQAAASRAAAVAAALGARFLHAQAKLEEGIALQEIGEHGASAAALVEAHRLAQAAGDRRGAAAAIFRLGVVRYWQGDFAASKDRVGEALVAYRALGSTKGEAEGLNFLGNIALQERDLPVARRQYEAAFDLYREIHDSLGMGKVDGNLGNVWFYEGDLEQAQRHYEAAVESLIRVGDRARAAAVTFNLANTLLRRGDLTAAAGRMRSAYRTLQELGDKSYRPFAICQSLGDIHLQRGDPAGAARWYARMTAVEEEQSPEARARGRLARAELALEEGDLSAAAALVREAVALMGGVESDDAHAAKHATLARLLLAQGRAAEAAAESARGLERARAAGDPWGIMTADLVGARVEIARGEYAGARARLQTILGEARRAGFAGLELEARMALAEVRLRQEGGAAARAHLQALAAEARQADFVLLARRTERVLAS